MTILVTGANGQLGNEMRIVSQSSAHRYVFTDVVDCPGVDTVKLDITDVDAVRDAVQEYGVDAIVNCAAYTNVDKAETDQEACAMLNTKAPENLALVMKEVDGLLIHLSTDYVFGGEKYDTPCTEDRAGAPTGVYGHTKLDGENAIIAVGCKHVIIRTAWLYSEFGRNFLKTMLSLTSSKPQINVVSDQLGTPTYALDLAEAVSAVLEDYFSDLSRGVSYAKTGIYHYSNEGECSWFDFAKKIAEYAGNTGCDIRPCSSDEFPSPVKRPEYSVLDKTKIKSVFGVKVPYWTDSLKKCLNNIL